ncbi:uncharacterized protein LOC124890675 [Capsicum annuum]|uniref:uncharacterized protein LOC124890675 n=1 Tax=Capsicum annuum TaxID=4072 RepID=UPI001FB0CF2F|nr:uncharacterized protein LOC124890675 [Capsicum annuum]
MTIKLVIWGLTLHVCSVYALQAGLDEKVKARFWEDLDEVVKNVPRSEIFVIAGDFNRYIGVLPGGYDDAHEKWVNREVYKVERKEAKLAVTSTKTTSFEILYVELEKKGEENRLYRLDKARERKGRDLDQVKCIKGDDGRVFGGGCSH